MSVVKPLSGHFVIDVIFRHFEHRALLVLASRGVFQNSPCVNSASVVPVGVIVEQQAAKLHRRVRPRGNPSGTADP